MPERKDANRLALKLARSVLDAAGNLALEAEGSAVAVKVERLPQPPWPSSPLEGLDAAADDPWPQAVRAECSWKGGARTLLVEADYWRTRGTYRHLERACAALSSGKHLLLVGPPGTGKTELAHALANAARTEGYCRGIFEVTASADWTTYETIGGYALERDNSLRFRAGAFLQAIEGYQWPSAGERPPPSTHGVTLAQAVSDCETPGAPWHQILSSSTREPVGSPQAGLQLATSPPPRSGFVQHPTPRHGLIHHLLSAIRSSAMELAVQYLEGLLHARLPQRDHTWHL